MCVCGILSARVVWLCSRYYSCTQCITRTHQHAVLRKLYIPCPVRCCVAWQHCCSPAAPTHNCHPTLLWTHLVRLDKAPSVYAVCSFICHSCCPATHHKVHVRVLACVSVTCPNTTCQAAGVKALHRCVSHNKWEVGVLC